ncbi:YqaJ viral recombinase family protein [Sphingobacterium sp. ML3W]
MGAKGLGQTGETYCMELAIDIVEGKDWSDEFTSFDMQRGIELEPIAFEKFSEIMSMDFIDVQKCGFIKLNKDTGSSPDGLVGDFGTLEIKCPKRDKFFNLVAFGSSEIDKAYLWQMQHQMMVTDRRLAYFFNYYIHNGKPLWHLLEVQRDDQSIDLMAKRIKEATNKRDEYVELISSNIQYKEV